MNENKQMTHHCLQVAPRTVGGEEPVKQKHNLLGVLNLPENGVLSTSGKAGVTS